MLRRYQPISLGALAEHLVMDRATLGHNLRPLQKAGWVALGTGADRRQRVLTLTKAGAISLSNAMPLWHAAQDGFDGWVGAQAAAELRTDLASIAQMKTGL